MSLKRGYLLLVLLCFIGFYSSVDAQSNPQEIHIPNRENSIEQQSKSYVILISIDGFRKDYIDKFDLPFLKAQREQSVWATSMIPSFPSITFANHYTLVTGMTPPHQGIIGNQMYDPKTKTYYSMRDKEAVTNPDWYGGIPLWSLAEQQNLLTACYYWPGSEAPIAGHYPTYYYPYNELTPVAQRIDQVAKWLELPEAERPHFITFYMPQVDQAGHRFGPDALETEYAAKYVDQAMKQLVEKVDQTNLPVNFIFLSDHGMTSVDTKHPLPLPDINSKTTVLVNNGTYINLFIEDHSKIKELYRNYKKAADTTGLYAVYLKDEVPEKYKFSTKEDTYDRIGDLVFIAEAPYFFSSLSPGIPRGGHGYLPADTPDMETVFMAWGSDIQSGKRIDSFKNIHIYPLITELLQLEYSHQIDGDKRLVPLVLKSK